MNTDMASSNSRRPTSRTAGPALARLEEALAIFTDNYPEATLTTLSIFLLVAQGRGARSGVLTSLSGMSQATVSRAVTALGKGTKDELGAGLLNQIIDPLNPRAKVVRLTPKGACLAEKMAELIGTTAISARDTMHIPDGSSGRNEVSPHFIEMHWSNWF